MIRYDSGQQPELIGYQVRQLMQEQSFETLEHIWETLELRFQQIFHTARQAEARTVVPNQLDQNNVVFLDRSCFRTPRMIRLAILKFRQRASYLQLRN